MSEQFSWVSDLTRAECLRPMEAEEFGSILSVVPAGFEAYARLFHPVERDRPRDTKTWSGIDEETHFEGVADIGAALETERVTWATAAESFGTAMHAEAQYPRLVRRDYGQAGQVIAADGWRYIEPDGGSLDPASLSAATAVLARHTRTPHAGVAAIWEGWGGLVSSAGVAEYWYAGESAAASAGLSLGGRLAAAARRSVLLARWKFMTRRHFRKKPKPGSGLLAREIATGPRLDLPGRSYILFEAGANDFTDPDWPHRAPWVDKDRWWAQSPSIIWPDDHAWVLATEIDFNSTLVAGTRALVRELQHTPGLEVLPIRPDANMSLDADVGNPPG